MWINLKNRYSVSNTATQVQLQSKLARISYGNESMQDYIDSFEEILNRLTATSSVVGESMLVVTFLASFGNKAKSPFGPLIASLQTRSGKLEWEIVTSTLIQQYEDHVGCGNKWIKTTKLAYHGQALTANSLRQGPVGKSRWRGGLERCRCYKCHRVEHIARNCAVQKKTIQLGEERGGALHMEIRMLIEPNF